MKSLKNSSQKSDDGSTNSQGAIIGAVENQNGLLMSDLILKIGVISSYTGKRQLRRKYHKSNNLFCDI